MLTIFSTPKPFRGHIAVIQRNALESWRRLHPDVEVILFGDDDGAAEVCREMGLRHVAHVERNAQGTKYLRSIWEPAQAMARHDLLCYANCDIVQTQEFMRAVERVAAWRKEFLMVGRRWDVDITAPIDFTRPQWEQETLDLAARANRQRPPQWVDYFVFRRGQFHDLPPFLIGRVGWDNWLLWHARQKGAAVVDASAAVRAVHQNHDYSYHPDGYQGVWHGEESQQNYALYESWRCLNTIADAEWVLEAERIRRTRRRWVVQAGREAAKLRSSVWHGLLSLTRPVRHKLGLRQETFARMAGRR
jgi:hypothetical protein